MNLIIERAQQVVEDIEHARSRRAFLSALDHFERMLALAPESSAGSLSVEDGATLGALADTVITHVEDRLQHRTDRATVQRALASRLYQIRNDLETVHSVVYS